MHVRKGPDGRRPVSGAEREEVPPDLWLTARAGGLMVLLNPNGEEDELNYQINLAMRNLYREGARRFRCVRLPRTGDDIKVNVYGWRE
jgi:hypothetical protein